MPEDRGLERVANWGRALFLALGLGSSWLALVPPEATAGTAPASGVRLQRVPPRSSTSRAGLQRGDVLYFWFRPASPPGNPEPASGFLRSPFDFNEVLSEQADRGEVTLWGKRDSRDMIWTLPPGQDNRWQTTVVAPNLDMTIDCSTVTSCRSQAARAEARGDALLAAWLLTAWLAGSLEGEESSRQAATILANHGELSLSANPLSSGCARLENLKFLKRARACYQEVYEIRRASAPGSLREQKALARLASLALQEGDFKAAEEIWHRLLQSNERQIPQAPWRQARNFVALSHTAIQRGHLEEAELHLRKALALAQNLPASSLLAEVLEVTGDFHTLRGNLPSAASAYQGAISASPQESLDSDSLLETRLRKLGRLEIARGNLARAEELLRRSLSLAEAWRGRPGLVYTGIALSLLDLAQVALRRGDLTNAETLLRRAREEINAALWTDPDLVIPGEIDVYNPLDPTAGLSLHLAKALAHLADIAEGQGQLEKAQEFLRQSLSVHSEPLTPLGIVQGLSLQALRARLGGDLSTARELLGQALARLQDQVPAGLVEARLHTELSEVFEHEAPTQAFARYGRALAIQRKLNPGSLDEAETLHLLGRAESKLGWIGPSTRHLCQAVEVLESRRPWIGGVPEARSLFEASTASYHRACLEALLQAGRKDEAFLALERGRARSFLSLLADRDLRFSELPPELAAERRRLDVRHDRLEAELAEKNLGRDDAEIDRLQAQLHDVRTRQEEILETIRRASPHLAAIETPAPLDLARAQAALDLGTALVSYSVGETKIFLFVIQPGATRAFSVYTVPVGEKALREEIGSFRNLLRNGRTDLRALDAQARRLYNLLLRPAEKRIASAKRLLVSPDGPLHTLPFAALRRRSHYLVEWKPVHSTLSATVYAEVKKSRLAPEDPNAVRLAAFGDPLYPAKKESRPTEQLADPEVRDAARGHGFPPLPATRREVEGIAGLFPQAEVYLGAEATEERAKQVAPEAHLLHFACHGFLNDRFPLNSGLALTLPDPPAEGQDNGLLQAWEIFEGLRLDADLVTLSACNTALGQEMGGEGLVGLTRAFQYAGARSVLASLWSVSDASTGELMKRFYTHLRAGKTKDEALRAAQSELIHKNDALSHPYHWAAFQLFGDWQ